MKMAKKVSIALGALFVLAIIAWRYGFSLDYQHDRNRCCELSAIQKNRIKSETDGMSGKELYEYSIKFASDKLSFSEKNDIPGGKANCVGYALLSSSVFNYAATVNHIDGSAKPVVGYVRFLGINLCSALQSVMPNRHWKNFVKDHDYTKFTVDGKTFYADACAYDLILNDIKTK